jgi:hypothetical protein
LGSNVNEYLQSEEAQDIIISATENTVDTKINTALKDYSLTTTIKSMISSAIIEAKKGFLDSAYPIGSLYWSRYDTDPATLFGGIWRQIKDRFILAAGDNYEIGTEGGESSIALAVEQLPAHNHTMEQVLAWRSGQGGYEPSLRDGGNYITQNYGTAHTGGNQPHNNMPPYDTFYCWERIDPNHPFETVIAPDTMIIRNITWNTEEPYIDSIATIEWDYGEMDFNARYSYGLIVNYTWVNGGELNPNDRVFTVNLGENNVQIGDRVHFRIYLQDISSGTAVGVKHIASNTFKIQSKSAIED